MDDKMIVSKLLTLSKLMYSAGEPFAKCSEKRGVYIFGCIRPFGEVVKNVVHRSIAIYLVTNQIEK